MGRMDKEQAISRLKEQQENGDIEIAHANADMILCELLTSLGFSDVVSEYKKIDKWFA